MKYQIDRSNIYHYNGLFQFKKYASILAEILDSNRTYIDAMLKKNHSLAKAICENEIMELQKTGESINSDEYIKRECRLSSVNSILKSKKNNSKFPKVLKYKCERFRKKISDHINNDNLRKEEFKEARRLAQVRLLSERQEKKHKVEIKKQEREKAKIERMSSKSKEEKIEIKREIHFNNLVDKGSIKAALNLCRNILIEEANKLNSQGELYKGQPYNYMTADSSIAKKWRNKAKSLAKR